MRVTGYAVMALGLIIAAYVVVANLMVNVRPNEMAGPIQGTPDGGPMYLFALIPAVGALLLGLWLVFHGREYRETYDLRRQQT